MGLFDNKSGGAGAAPPGQDQQLATLKAKYQTVITVMEQQGVRLQDLHVEGGKLVIRGEAPSQKAKDLVWDQIKVVSANPQDLVVDITVAAGSEAKAPSAGRTYTVKAGDTLSKISKDYYGNANAYKRIFEANRDKLNDPDKIKPGQVLNIP